MIRPLQRVPSWLPWLLATIGVVGLLLPWLLSPVTSDERYHYPAAPGRMADNVFNVLTWTINDLDWRMAAGRIAPVGVFLQHVIYLLGMQFAFSAGVPLFVVHGVVKVLLLAAVVGSFALLLTQLRRRDGASLEAPTRTTAVLLFTALLVLGVTSSSPNRNGWTTFIVLCIGGIALMFLVGAASLWVLRGWSRWGAFGKALSGVGMLVLGVVVMLSYEMHWAAIPFAIILLAFAGRAGWPHRLILLAILGSGWLAAVLWTRALIAAAPRITYAGLMVDLGGSVPKVIVLQLVNAVPGSGIPLAVRNVGDGLAAPRPFEGTGWLWGRSPRPRTAPAAAQPSDAGGRGSQGRPPAVGCARRGSGRLGAGNCRDHVGVQAGTTDRYLSRRHLPRHAVDLGVLCWNTHRGAADSAPRAIGSGASPSWHCPPPSPSW